MKLIIAASVLALLGAGAATADDHAAHHPPKLQDTQADADKTMIDKCEAMMGHDMKPGAPAPADGVAGSPPASTPPMSPAEMKAMHEKCEAMMKKMKADQDAKPAQ